jgi:hypothetical protein
MERREWRPSKLDYDRNCSACGNAGVPVEFRFLCYSCWKGEGIEDYDILLADLCQLKHDSIDKCKSEEMKERLLNDV